MTKLLQQIRVLTIVFIIALFISGVTAFPVYTELQWIINSNIFPENSLIAQWFHKVWIGVKKTHEDFPFIFYGFDWLAFAHLVIAILFIGVYQHPVCNRWIIQWAMITCICILPLAFIAGSLRGIPFFHILIDCSFGVIGLIPLLIIQFKIKKLAVLKKAQRNIVKGNS
ncbi:MAG TPA: hypothetical protein VGI61_04070 [Parafilimonas sp.]